MDMDMDTNIHTNLPLPKLTTVSMVNYAFLEKKYTNCSLLSGPHLCVQVHQWIYSGNNNYFDPFADFVGFPNYKEWNCV